MYYPNNIRPILAFLACFLFCQIQGFNQVFDINFANLGLARADLLTYERGFKLFIQDDNKVLHIGQSSGHPTFGPHTISVLRYNYNGQLDSSYSDDGVRLVKYQDLYDTYYHASDLQADQKLLLAGYCSSCRFVQRYLPDGSLDTSFADAGTLDVFEDGLYWDQIDVRALDNGQILLIRRYKPSAVAPVVYALYRYENDGTLDLTYGTNGRVDLEIPDVGEFLVGNYLILENQNFMASGSLMYVDSFGTEFEDLALLRWLPNGQLDPSFGDGGLARHPVLALSDMKLDAGGNAVCVGTVNLNQQGTTGSMAILRFDENGLIDSSFAVNGVQSVDIGVYADYANTVEIQANGNILIGGSYFNFGGGSVTDCALVRLLPDGSFDPDFGEDGVFKAGVASGTDIITDIALQDDNKVVFGGYGNYASFDIITARVILDNLVVTADQNLCAGESLVLNASTEWTPIGWANAENPDSLLTTGLALTVSPEETSTYLFYTNEDTASVTITILSAPSVQLPADTMFCAGEQLQVQADYPGAQYLWQDGSTNSGFVIEDSGIFWVDVSNACGTVRDSIAVDIIDLSFANLGDDQSHCDSASVVLGMAYPDLSYLWQDGSTEPIFTVSETGLYWLEVGLAGCQYRDSIYVELLTSSQADLMLTVCDSFTSPSGQFVWMESGVYQDVIPNAAGCDSLLTIHLTIPEIDATVSQNGGVLSANSPGLFYQWYRCENGLEVLPGETAQAFTVPQSGQYAVEVSDGLCSAFSECVQVDIVSSDSPEKDSFLLYPNPASDRVYLRFDSPGSRILSLTDMQGREVYTATTSDVEHPLSLAALPSGCYVLQVYAQGRVLRALVVRK
ncbi:MAG: T9SS type A sorting domain-containing protein [Saprospiraceae bacterium]